MPASTGFDTRSSDRQARKHLFPCDTCDPICGLIERLSAWSATILWQYAKNSRVRSGVA